MSDPSDDDDARKQARRARAAAKRLHALGGIGSVSDIARAWQISEGAVRAHTKKPTFPAPVLTVGGRDVWPMAEVHAWRATQPTRSKRA